MALGVLAAVMVSSPLEIEKGLRPSATLPVPVRLGSTYSCCSPLGARVRLDQPVRIVSALVLAGIIAATMLKERDHLLASFATVGLPALTFNLVSLGVGFLLPRLFRLERRQATAIAMEIGIHNGTLAIAYSTTKSTAQVTLTQNLSPTMNLRAAWPPRMLQV